MTIREKAQAYLDAQEAEARARRAYENAKENCSDHKAYGATYEAAMLVTGRALEAFRAELAKDTVEVPSEPTEAMIAAGWDVEELKTPERIYRAMLAAREKP